MSQQSVQYEKTGNTSPEYEEVIKKKITITEEREEQRTPSMLKERIYLLQSQLTELEEELTQVESLQSWKPEEKKEELKVKE